MPLKYPERKQRRERYKAKLQVIFTEKGITLHQIGEVHFYMVTSSGGHILVRSRDYASKAGVIQGALSIIRNAPKRMERSGFSYTIKAKNGAVVHTATYNSAYEAEIVTTMLLERLTNVSTLNHPSIRGFARLTLG